LKNKGIFILLFLLCCLDAIAWNWWHLPISEPDTCSDTLLYVGKINALYSNGAMVPTWLHANQNGEIANLPYSGNIQLGIVKPATRPNRWFDYSGGVVLTGRIAGSHLSTIDKKIETTGFFSLLYAHIRLYILDITMGIKPLYFTPSDKELSCGSLLFSNNIHPIPHISIHLENWTPIPGLFGYAEIKGGITHGWLADNAKIVQEALLHHKYIGGRIGGELPVNVSYELHHATQWGGNSIIYGDLGHNWTAFKNVFFAQSGGTINNEKLNAQGNHLLSQTLCITTQVRKWKLNFYWQDIQEDARPRFIGTGQNNKDGLWGISATQDVWPFIGTILFEVLKTSDQSGPWHDRDGMVFGGNDNYYNNGIYQDGWTYWGRTIGMPLLSLTNNRVSAYHTGIKGNIYGYKYRVMCSYVDNYGTYNKPLRSNNTAILLECSKHIEKAWGLDICLSLAGDFGNQFGNTFGAMLTIKKQGIITTYK
jgi:hypothetical protein